MIYRFMLLLLLSYSLTACSGSFRESMGLRKNAPDEFMVSSNPSLVVPPSFHLPAPGITAAQNDTKRTAQARNTLLKKPALTTAKISGIERTLLNKTSTSHTHPNIRKIITTEYEQTQTQKAKKEEGFFESINPFESKNEDIINPNDEQARLRKTVVHGKPQLNIPQDAIAAK